MCTIKTCKDYKDALCKVLAPILKRNGFVKSGPTWRKEEGDCTLVIHVTSIGGMSWMKCRAGIFLHNIENKPRPAIHECHISKMFDWDRRRPCILDFRTSLPWNQRAHLIERLILERVLPWLCALARSKERKRVVISGRNDGTLMVRDEALELIGIKKFRPIRPRGQIRIHTLEVPSGFDPDQPESEKELEAAFREIAQRAAKARKRRE